MLLNVGDLGWCVADDLMCRNPSNARQTCTLPLKYIYLKCFHSKLIRLSCSNRLFKFTKNHRYFNLMSAPRFTEDSTRSEEDQLLPSSSTTRIDMGVQIPKFPQLWSITIDVTLIPRSISTVLSLTSFIIFCIDGGSSFIAADIFLMVTILYNIIITIHYCLSNLLKVTVELPQQAWKREIATPQNLNLPQYLDIIFASLSFLCVVIGRLMYSSWDDEPKDACIVAYFAVLMQVLCSLMHSKVMTLSAKFTDS